MKTFVFLFIVAACSLSFFTKIEDNISQKDLRTTCKVLYQLTDEAIDNDRKDNIAIYYNAYYAIRGNYNITDGCDQYFEGISSSYFNDIGSYNINLESPPKAKEMPKIVVGGFTHQQVQVLEKITELNITMDDLEKYFFYNELQKGYIDLNKLKPENIDDLMKIYDNMNKINLNHFDANKVKDLPNKKLEIKEFNEIIKNKN
ncbi:hypothetical protein R9C00_06835 [Flammeovirgaceae bacterium SG7u.111]|nr:hypothetical protein [Flammeovirgaceae bacterium SG7u.132]WPO37158.1 hypothetical protein R9C00_06835 [Flammeovirgaceae bacterium SG7u.111]